MKILIESTEQIDVLPGGHVCRVWRGVTEGGVECAVRVAKIGCSSRAATDEFERNLAPLGWLQLEADRMQGVVTPSVSTP